MRGTKGKVVGINGNMVSVEFDGLVTLNEVGYVHIGDTKLKSEIIRIRGSVAQMQVFEITKGIRVGDEVEFTGDLLSVELGPGLLGRVYDGLQNPLPDLAEKATFWSAVSISMRFLPKQSGILRRLHRSAIRSCAAMCWEPCRKGTLPTGLCFPSVCTAHTRFLPLNRQGNTPYMKPLRK